MSETMTDEFRDSIRRLKAGLKSSSVDLAAAFAKIDRLVETQVRQIEAERDAGMSTIPECEFADIAAGTVSDELSGRIRQRGAVIYMTDGFGRAPDRPPPYECLWVVPETGADQFGFGDVIKLTAI